MKVTELVEAVAPATFAVGVTPIWGYSQPPSSCSPIPFALLAEDQCCVLECGNGWTRDVFSCGGLRVMVTLNIIVDILF